MANYKHMNLDERMEIQKGLKEGKSFAEIGAAIGRDGSTISKEIRSHLIVKETGTRSRPYNCKWEMQDSEGSNCFPNSRFVFDVIVNVSFDYDRFKKMEGQARG